MEGTRERLQGHFYGVTTDSEVWNPCFLWSNTTLSLFVSPTLLSSPLLPYTTSDVEGDSVEDTAGGQRDP